MGGTNPWKTADAKRSSSAAYARRSAGAAGSCWAGTWAELLSFTLKGLIERTGIDPSEVDDVIGGCVSQVGEQALNVTRNAWLDAGLPESTPATTVDRQCGSGLQALQFAAQGVMAAATTWSSPAASRA